LLEIHLKLRVQQETETQQQADTPHIHYHDVPTARKVARQAAITAARVFRAQS
jgi:hypothetical protein